MAQPTKDTRGTIKKKGDPVNAVDDTNSPIGVAPKHITHGKSIESKIKAVRDVVPGWEDEEILRVLEKHNYDERFTIETIVEGTSSSSSFSFMFVSCLPLPPHPHVDHLLIHCSFLQGKKVKQNGHK
jgi:hypothetical protein